MSDRISKLEMVLSEMDSQLHHVAAVVLSQVQPDDDDHDAKTSLSEASMSDRSPMRDEVWGCSNCSARLGIYNKNTDELRVRYKDFVAYVIPGSGSRIMVPCRRCGEQNVLTDIRKKQ
mgnify:CR=1 FL=1